MGLNYIALSCFIVDSDLPMFALFPSALVRCGEGLWALGTTRCRMSVYTVAGGAAETTEELCDCL